MKHGRNTDRGRSSKIRVCSVFHPWLNFGCGWRPRWVLRGSKFPSTDNHESHEYGDPESGGGLLAIGGHGVARYRWIAYAIADSVTTTTFRSPFQMKRTLSRTSSSQDSSTATTRTRPSFPMGTTESDFTTLSGSAPNRTGRTGRASTSRGYSSLIPGILSVEKREKEWRLGSRSPVPTTTNSGLRRFRWSGISNLLCIGA